MVSMMSAMESKRRHGMYNVKTTVRPRCFANPVETKTNACISETVRHVLSDNEVKYGSI